MRTHISTVFLSRSPSFCLLVVFSTAMMSENVFISLLYAIITLAIVMWGSRLVGWMSQTFGELLYIIVLTLLCLVFGMIPRGIYHILELNMPEKNLNITSMLMGCTWIIAHIEYSNTKKISDPFIQSFSTILAFSIIFAIALIFKLIFGYTIMPFANIQFIQNISSEYWTSLSGSFLISGIILFFLQKLEYRILLDSQKK